MRLTLLSLALLVASIGAAPFDPMPAPVKAKLDAAFPGWRMAPLNSRAARGFRSKHPSWPSNVLTGDFDGNKTTDYAVLMEHKGKTMVAAVLDSGKTLTLHSVTAPEQPDPRMWLCRMTAGSSRTDLDTRKPIPLPFDTIGLSDGGNTSRTFLYEKGKFREIRTSE